MNILGCPIKVAGNCSVNLPVNYLHAFGIDIYCDFLICEKCEKYFIFRPYIKRELKQNETIEKVRAGNLYFPKHWLIKNNLKPGNSFMYIIGVDGGLLLSITQIIKF